MDKQASYDMSIIEQPAIQTEAAEAVAVTAAVLPVTWRDYVTLAKPGIIFSNMISAFGGFWIASGWKIDWILLIYMCLGTILVLASGCVLNNFLDREMDMKMTRTKKRVLPSGRINPQIVLIYGITLGVIGLAVLYKVNPLSCLLGLLGLFGYVWVYTAWFKRTSVWSTFVGSFSGAIPPVIGYCAVANTLDAGAWILFAFLFLWQPPHFWALGIRRMEEYREAGFPLLPVVKGSYVTKLSMVRYIVLIIPVSVLLCVYGYVGKFYLITAVGMGLIWLFMSLQGFKAEDEEQWAKKMFVYSINYLTLLIIMMVIDTVAQ